MSEKPSTTDRLYGGARNQPAAFKPRVVDGWREYAPGAWRQEGAVGNLSFTATPELPQRLADRMYSKENSK